MSVKNRDILRVHTKLQLQSENTHHRVGWFIHDGKRILKTYMSHGNKDVPTPVFHKMRSQLKVNEDQMAGLIHCSIDLPAYIEILKAKKVIQ